VLFDTKLRIKNTQNSTIPSTCTISSANVLKKSVNGKCLIFEATMETIKCIILDDQLEDRLIIETYLASFPDFEIVGTFEEPLAALRCLSENKIDVMFSDVEMPSLNGFEFYNTLLQKPITVFISSFPTYAATGFDVEAFDFITKPIPLGRFTKTIIKIQEHFKNLTPTPANTQDFFVVKTNSEFVRINHHEVYYIEAMSDFVNVKTMEKKMVVLVNLKNLMEQIPEQIFVRCHRSYIVNIEKIIKYDGSNLYLSDDIKIPVGREFASIVEQSFLGNNLIKRKTK